MVEYFVQEENLKKACYNRDDSLAILYRIVYGSTLSWNMKIDGAEFNQKILEYFRKYASSTSTCLEMFCEDYGAVYPEDAVTFKERVHEIVKKKHIISRNIESA